MGKAPPMGERAMNTARLLLGLAVAWSMAHAAWADYGLGLAAFERGDVATAEREFLALAQQGYTNAQYSLAMLYLKADPPDYARARPWLERSADRGLPESQYMLGMLTLYGVGMAENAELGERWLERASQQGHEDAQALLAKLEQARRQQAAAEQRKAEQARKLRAELKRAEAAEQALKKQLAQSKQREMALASERQSLKKARMSDTKVKEQMRSEQARLEAALETLRVRLAEAEAERARDEARGVVREDTALMTAPAATEPVREEMAGEGVLAGKVVEILPDGVLLAQVSRRVGGRSEPFPEDFVVFLNLATTDGLSEGQQVAYPAEPATPYRYKYESGATGRIRAFRALGK